MYPLQANCNFFIFHFQSVSELFPVDGFIIFNLNFVGNGQKRSSVQNLGIRPFLSINRFGKCCKNKGQNKEARWPKGDVSMENSRRKRIISSVITLSVLALVLTLVFRGQSAEVLECLRTVPRSGVLWLFLMALGCPALDAAAEWVALRPQVPNLTFRQALTAAYLNIFGNVATMGAGSVPLQSWYLSFYGLLPGAGVGLLTLCYAIQKTTVLLYATVMLALQGGWLRASNVNLSRYLLLGYVVCALIILALILLCTWEKVQRLALWGIGKLPDTGKWAERKSVWAENIESLRTQSKAFLSQRRRCAALMAIYAGKFFLLYTVSYRSISLLGLDQLSLWRVQLLSAVMVLITNAIPNVGGAGPAELAFILLYSPYLGNANAASAMVLYRTATYLLPFLVSIPVVLYFQHLIQKRKTKLSSAPTIQA